jgi:hypothetical protein
VIYKIIAVLVFIVALVALLLAARLLLNKKWIAGFLRGCLGILLLCLTAVLAFSAKDILSYRGAENNQTIATLSFRKKDGNLYQLELQESGGNLYTTDIEGQQWQLYSRMFKWTPLAGALGFRPGYRLESVAGRFIELQLDKASGKHDAQILNSSGQVDVWQFLNKHPVSFLSVDAYMSSPGFIPVADGAIFDLVLSGQNLTVNPLNDAAKSALKSW